MLIDGLNLAEGSVISNLSVATGTAFPSFSNEGEVFYRSDVGNEGMYTYTSSAWVKLVNVNDFSSLVPDLGTPGTYKSVTTDAKGRVISGTNPSTLSGFGITDAVNVSALGANSGIATLDAQGKVIGTQMPAIAITDTFVVASQVAQLALTAQTGDVAVRTDLSKSFILKGTVASTLTDWQELLTPTQAVQSVNGMTGAVTIATGSPALTAKQIGYGSASNLLSGSSKFTFDDTTNTLLFGDGTNYPVSTNVTISPTTTVAGSNAAGGTLFLLGGNAGDTVHQGGGNVVIKGGTGIGALTGTSVTITAGPGTFSTGTGGLVSINGGVGVTIGGPIILSTATTTALIERFRILANGAWSVGAAGTNTGTSGQVLTSGGASAVPTWATAATGFSGGTVTGATTFTSSTPQLTLGVAGSVDGKIMAASGSTGSAIIVQAGASSALPGGNASLVGGDGGGTYNGGNAYVTGGISAGTGGGGPVLVTGGASSATAKAAGYVSISGGASSSTGAGGGVNLYGGSGGTTGSGGSILLQAGTMNASPGLPGTVSIMGGYSSVSGIASGSVTIHGGDGALAGVQGGTTIIKGGQSGYLGSGGTGGGGNVDIRGGTADSGTGAGGYVVISTGLSSTLAERFRILNNGAWSVGPNGTDTGTSGQVLTSGGASAAPAWAAPALPTGSLSFSSNYTELRSDFTAIASSTIDCSLANNFNLTMSASITTLAFSNIPVSGRVYNMTLYINQDATGSRTIVWPASVKFSGGIAPVLTTTPNKTDIITLATHNGGTSWFGFIAGQNF